MLRCFSFTKNRFKIFFKITIIIAILILIFQSVFFYFNFLFKKNLNQNKEIDLKKINNLNFFESPKLGDKSINLREEDFNKYCDIKGEWLNLNNEHFFKNGAAFYIIDESKAHIYFLTRSSIINPLELNLIIKIGNNEEFRYVVKAQTGNPWFVNGYASCTIDSFFSLKEVLFSEKNIDLIKNLNKITVLFYIRDTIRNTITNKPMELKLKYLKREKKKSAILCAKCLYLNADEYLHLNWWIELNKRSGYEKIVMCNQSLEANSKNIFLSDFKDVIEKYGDFIELSQLECIPDFTSSITGHSKYFNTFQMMKVDGHFNAFMTDTINILVLGQCYLDNIDKYDYIAVFDNDETVLPKISDQFSSIAKSFQHFKSFKIDNSNKYKDLIFNDKCNHFKINLSHNKIPNHIYSYLKKIENDQKIIESSLYFYQGYFFSYKMASHIFEYVSNYFVKNSFNDNKLTININHDENLKITEFPINRCSLTISNREEYDYLMNLIQIVNLIIKPYLDENRDIINKFANRYERFFVILKNQDTLGKTIHNTKSTFEFSLHEPMLYLNNVPNMYSRVENENGYLHHFRGSLSKIGIDINVYDIYLDLNFFNCFFVPIIESFKV